MSRLIGGIFSRPSGQTSGIVFGAAKTRRGKVVTTRQKVIPANPRTPAQILQRQKFSAVSEIIRQINPEILSRDLNNKLGGLSGYNALSSRLLSAMPGEDVELGQIAPLTLGSLHFSSEVEVDSPVADEIQIEWDGEDEGFNGAANDLVSAVLVQTNLSDPSQTPLVINRFDAAAREDGSITFEQEGIGQIACAVGLYFRGAADGDFPGLLSRMIWFVYDPVI